MPDATFDRHKDKLLEDDHVTRRNSSSPVTWSPTEK